MAAKSFSTKINIQQAWAWIKSNPDRSLKDGYGMRHLYQQVNVIEEEFVNTIVSELKSGTYKPTPACKVYLPKSSGGLRPYSLLTVKDQVVYQAMVNIIAEQLLPKVENRYYDKIFGNLYGGNKGVWFYKKWKDGYRKFNESARHAFAGGKVYMASFDLVACYDSIDHEVLEHYLIEIGVPKNLIQQLRKCLAMWTSTEHDDRIYQGHGIPQGPMSSGLLSEVVLRAFDNERRSYGVSYIRYVDDIWFFAKNEKDLRFELVRMDRICKKVGLFPQSSKINIRQVKDIENELKTISGMFDNLEEVHTDDYFKFIKQITKKDYKIKDISKFKYCVAAAKPTSELIKRLWQIYSNHPDIYPQLSNVICKAGKLTEASRSNIKNILEKPHPYINIQASFIEALIKIKLNDHDIRLFTNIIKKQFGTSMAFCKSDARLTALAFEFLYKHRKITETQMVHICNSPFWYTRREIARFLGNTESKLIKSFLDDDTLDVQIIAAGNIVGNDIQIPIKRHASPVDSYFKCFGLLTQGANDPCKINLILNEMLKLKVTIDWKLFLGARYKQALRVLVECHSSYSTHIGAWVCGLDSFNDILVRSLFDKDTSLGSVGRNYGGVLNQQGNHAFILKFKTIHDPCTMIHNRRKTTVTAHAYDTKTNIPATPFKHSEVPVYIKQQVKLIKALSVAII